MAMHIIGILCQHARIDAELLICIHSIARHQSFVFDEFIGNAVGLLKSELPSSSCTGRYSSMRRIILVVG